MTESSSKKPESQNKERKGRSSPSGLKRVIWLVAGAVFAGILWIWGKSTYLFRIKAGPNGVTMREFSDLYLVVLAAIAHYVI